MGCRARGIDRSRVTKNLKFQQNFINLRHLHHVPSIALFPEPGLFISLLPYHNGTTMVPLPYGEDYGV